MNEVKGKIDHALSYIKWGSGVAFTLLVALYILEMFGVRVVGLPPASTAVYVAAIYWATRG